MTPFDFVILAILIISTVVGVMRGFIKEVFSILAWVVAIWLAKTFATDAGVWISESLSFSVGPILTGIIGFSVILVIVLFASAIIIDLLAKLLVQKPVRGIDRVLGIATGLVRGVAIAAVLLVMMRALGANASVYWTESRFIPHLLPAVDLTQKFLPRLWKSDEPIEEGELKDKLIEQGVEHIKEQATT